MSDGPEKYQIKKIFEMIGSIDDRLNDITLRHTKPFLTTREAAAYLGLSTSKLYKMTMEKEITHFRPHGKLLFRRDDLDEWIQARIIKSRYCDAENSPDDVLLRNELGVDS